MFDLDSILPSRKGSKNYSYLLWTKVHRNTLHSNELRKAIDLPKWQGPHVIHWLHIYPLGQHFLVGTIFLAEASHWLRLSCLVTAIRQKGVSPLPLSVEEGLTLHSFVSLWDWQAILLPMEMLSIFPWPWQIFMKCDRLRWWDGSAGAMVWMRIVLTSSYLWILGPHLVDLLGKD